MIDIRAADSYRIQMTGTTAAGNVFGQPFGLRMPYLCVRARVHVCCELSGAAPPDSSTFCSLETSMKKINLSADRYLSLKAWDLAPSHIITGPFGNKSSIALDFMYM